MNSLNSIILEGNIVQEPVLRTTPKGTPVCTFSLMCMRTYKQDEGYEKEISFFDVDAWAKLADVCVKNGTKGRGLRVVGRLKQSRWTDLEGKNHSKVSVVAEHVEFKPVFKKSTDDTQSQPDGGFDDGSVAENVKSGANASENGAGECFADTDEAQTAFVADESGSGFYPSSIESEASASAGTKAQTSQKNGCGSGKTEKRQAKA